MASFSEADGKDLVPGSGLSGTEASASLNLKRDSPGAENSPVIQDGSDAGGLSAPSPRKWLIREGTATWIMWGARCAFLTPRFLVSQLLIPLELGAGLPVVRTL